MKNSVLLKITSLALIFTASLNAFPSDGGSNTGGGNGVGNRLFDFIEAAPKVEIKHLKFYPAVEAVLGHLYATAPQVAASLEEQITGSKWLMDPRPLNPNCLNQTSSGI